MDDVLVLKRTWSISETGHETRINIDHLTQSISGESSSSNKLLAGCGINFFRYLRHLNLSNATDVLVLPQNQHYYYDGKELESIRVLINLKRLNLIKHLDMFLNTLVRVLPGDSSFIGCFSDSDPVRGREFQSGLPSKWFERFINFLDAGTNNLLDRKEVTELLNRNGFDPVDMSEIQGLTFFCCRKSGTGFN